MLISLVIRYQLVAGKMTYYTRGDAYEVG